MVDCFGLRNLGVVMGRAYTAGGLGGGSRLAAAGVDARRRDWLPHDSVLMLATGLLAFVIVKDVKSNKK